MRFPADRFAVQTLASVSLIALLAGCGQSDGYDLAPAAPVQASFVNGPAADYPVVLGDPFTIEGVTYTPEDKMNYDHVGRAVMDRAGGNGISAMHRTLPLPSYVEVTSLETGKTILVRVERRGPMTGSGLIGLSQGALAELQMAEGTAIRVRRVNPPEAERALLRAGQPAPERIETPMSLVAVLLRKLPEGEQASASLANTRPASSLPRELEPIDPGQSNAEQTALTDALPPLATFDQPVARPATQPATRPVQVVEGGFVVQAGAYSSAGRAERVADVIGGSVSQSGSLYRVRTGPFATRGEAEASLAKVQAAGYREARIFTQG
jgi:rare lipoprotein A